MSSATSRLLLGLAAGALVAAVLIASDFSRCSSIVAGLCAAYLPSLLDGAQYKVTPREGSRYWPWFAKLPIWRLCFSYFPASITTEYDFSKHCQDGGQYTFAMHPHGMLSVDHGLVFTDAVGFISKVLPAPRRDLGASVIFLVPFLREFCLWLGTVDAGAPTANRILSNGYSMQLYPGGIAEQLATDSSQPKIVGKGRMGFIKLSLSYDVPIVPVYVFGEDKLYTSVSFLLGARRWLCKVARIGIPLYFGRLITGGLLPEQQPLEAVLGEPLWPEGVTEETQRAVHKARLKATASPAATDAQFAKGRRVRRDVSPAEVEAMHARYLVAIEALFEKHKHKHPAYANSKLTILSA